MSEIKGQLLGIILVLLIFGAIAAGLVAAFTNLSDNIVDEVNDIGSSLTAIKMLF